MAGSPPLSPTLRRRSRPPMGLKNLWNSSCYLNSVLQCLTFTGPLADYCKRERHLLQCTRGEYEDCTFCILERRIVTSLMAAGPVDTPKQLYNHVTTKSGLFQPRRHEDAHELLSFLIGECRNPDTSNEAELSLPSLFGGKMRSRIECGQCGARSNMVEEMMDLGLDIFEKSSLIEAFNSYFRPEVLDGDNKYRCGSCNNLSDARKQVSILQMPQVLIIHMKRFDPCSGKKLSHHVHFEKQLSLAKYLSEKFTDGPVPHYTLYGLNKHSGASQLHGHYVAFVKEKNGKWYLCNDGIVFEVSEKMVLSSNAYLLFYIRSDIDQGSSSNQAVVIKIDEDQTSTSSNQTDESNVGKICTSNHDDEED